MQPQDYTQLSEKTLSTGFYVDADDQQLKNLIHAAIGLSTEAGEILDTIKKTVFYGKELDVKNIKEEFGDVLWYLAIICRELDISFEDMMDANVEKLRKRYGEKFTQEKALERDVANELSHM